MIVVAILSSYSYSITTENKSIALRLDNFCNSTDSMKQLTESYLYAEKDMSITGLTTFPAII